MSSSRRAASFLLASGAAAALGWWACSGEQEDGAGGGTGGAGGSGASTGGDAGFDWGGGGAAATAGAGASGGSGGTAADGGVDWGAAPKWEPFPGSAAGCTFERLANAAELRVLAWEPCSWSAGCEQAVFNPKLVGSAPGFYPTSEVHDDGTTVRVGLSFGFSNVVTLFADGGGMGLDGFRSPDPIAKCQVWSASMWGNRFGVVAGTPGTGNLGGVLGQVGATTAPPATFTLASPPPGTPQRYVLSEQRWLWWWVPVDRFSSVSALDGSGFTLFAKASPSGPAVGYGNPISAGPYFLFDEFVLLDGGVAQRRISRSDGLAMPEPYLVPSDPNDDYGRAAYADSHVGFLKGIGRKGISTFDSVEVWTVPFDSSGAAVNAELVAQFPLDTMEHTVGGWGRLAAPTAPLPNGDLELTIWNLDEKSSETEVLPEDHETPDLLGLSRDHLYVGADKPNIGSSAYLVRYAAQ